MMRSCFLLTLLFTAIPTPFATAQIPENIQSAIRTAGLDPSRARPVSGQDGFFQVEKNLVFVLNRGSLRFPRQFDVVDDVYAISSAGKKVAASLRQDPTNWTVSCDDSGALVGVIRFQHDYQHLTEAPTIRVVPGQVASFPARFADTGPSSDKLQFEPLAYKNTVGYWVNRNDKVHWNFQVDEPGRFQVRILQGCGQGQGGSRITIQVGEKELPFEVKETGQFQAFRWFDVGEVEFEQKTAGQLSVAVNQLARNAVMDIREIRLEPVGSAGKKPDRPNVLVFYADDLGSLDVNCFGSRDLHTPNLDGLAQRGVRFTQAYAHTVCCPSRAMLMTGRAPQRCNVNNWMQGNAKAQTGRNMNLDEITMAEYLRKAGYRTALFGKWHLGAAPTHGPTLQGFDQFFGIRGGFVDNDNHHFLHGTGYHDLYEGPREVFHPGEYLPDLITDRAVKFMESNAESPFLLMVPYNLPHYPEQSDPVFEQRYSRLAEPRKSYAKTVSTVDERIGRVLRKLDELRLAEQTIVIFMSDNGHSTENYAINVGNHASGLAEGSNYGANGGGGNTGQWRGHKGTFLEGGIRVPAIVSFPGKLPTGVVRDQAITACDWLPTVLELCGVEPEPERKLDGQSLLPIVLENAPSHHKVLHWQWQNRWAVRQGDWKLVVSPDRTELLNLADRPPESRDHAAEKPDLVRELRELHETWLEDVSPK